MRWNFGSTCAAALLSLASLAEAGVYIDSVTGFTFSQYDALYALGKTITFRVAVPTGIPASTPYPVVIQVVAPSEVGWAGLAWGGTMTYNPLTAQWVNGNTVQISSRYTTSHSAPPAYSGATYEIFKTGTKVNGTHWQYTAKCTGCTSFTGSSNRQVFLNPNGTNRLAFASSTSKPSSPSSNTTTLPVHDVANYWTWDFAAGANPQFSALLVKNLGHA